MTKNQHGFSLVEIIVVIAIMAVLVGIITPAYLSYIEKTRIQKDESAAGEIYRAAEIVVYTGEYEIEGQVFLTFDQYGIQLNEDGVLNQDEVIAILKEHFGDQYSSVVPVSKKYKNETYTITILPPPEGSEMPQISGSWSS